MFILALSAGRWGLAAPPQASHGGSDGDVTSSTPTPYPTPTIQSTTGPTITLPLQRGLMGTPQSAPELKQGDAGEHKSSPIVSHQLGKSLSSWQHPQVPTADVGAQHAAPSPAC